MLSTHLSSKGQVVIPRAIREEHHWGSGMELMIEDHQDGIKLKPRKPFKTVAVDDLVGCTGYKGKRKTLAAMKQGIVEGIGLKYGQH